MTTTEGEEEYQLLRDQHAGTGQAIAADDKAMLCDHW